MRIKVSRRTINALKHLKHKLLIVGYGLYVIQELEYETELVDKIFSKNKKEIYVVTKLVVDSYNHQEEVLTELTETGVRGFLQTDLRHARRNFIKVREHIKAFGFDVIKRKEENDNSD